MDHNFHKRPGSHITGPEPKRPVDLSTLTQGVDYMTFVIDGETVNVLMDDLRAAQNMPQTTYLPGNKIIVPPSTPASQSTQVFSPPHTRNGTSYTPIQPRPPAPFTANQNPIRQPTVTLQQQQQNFHQQQQQMQQAVQSLPPLQQQNSHLKSMLIGQPQVSYSTAVASTSSSTMVTPSSKPGIDSHLVSKINKLHSTVFHSTSGITALTGKVQKLEDDFKEETCVKSEIKEIRKEIAALKAQNIQVSVEGNAENVLNQKLDDLFEENRDNKEKLNLLGSFVHRQGNQIESLQVNSVITTSMFMANTMYIRGLRVEANENTRGVVINFLRDRMNIFPPSQEILSAQRTTGAPIEKTIKGVKYVFPPSMEVLCSPALRHAMWENRRILKNQRDPTFNWPFFVSLKKPEDMRAWDARYKPAMEAVYKANKEKPSQSEWDTPKVVRGKFTINGEVIPDPIYVPDVKSMMDLTRDDINQFADIQFEVSRDFVLSKSTFRGYCTSVTNYREVEQAYKKLKYEERYATHIMMACLFKSGRDDEFFSCDDGEASGGIEILNLLQATKSIGFAIFVIRWKAGGNMGSRRFACIKAVAKAALEKRKTKMEMLHHPPTTSATASTSSSETAPTSTTTTSTV